MFGSQVAAWRQKLGLTQEVAAKMSGVPRKQLWKLENDKIVTIQTFSRIVTALKIPVLTFGETEIVTHDLDLANLRQVTTQAIDALETLRGLIDVLSPKGEVRSPLPPPAEPYRAPISLDDPRIRQILEVADQFRAEAVETVPGR
jgi:transcriptional regulator with XRE-family HTH domain